MKKYLFMVLIAGLFLIVGCETLQIIPDISSVPETQKIDIVLYENTGIILRSYDYYQCDTCSSNCCKEAPYYSKKIDKSSEQTFYLSSGKDIGLMQVNLLFKGKPLPVMCSASSISCPKYTNFYSPKYELNVRCIESGNEKIIYSKTQSIPIDNCKISDSTCIYETLNLSENIDISSENCNLLKAEYRLSNLAVGQQYVILDADVFYSPKTYKKILVSDINLLIVSGSEFVCPVEYAYCSFTTENCMRLKNHKSNQLTNCQGDCTIIIQKSTNEVYSCDLRIDGNMPSKADLIAHSYTPLCINEACPLSSKQCSGSQPQKCVDTNNDNCGDIWQNEGSSCSGNYECSSGACVCKPSILCSNGKANNDRWCEANGIKKCVVNQQTCTANIITETSCVSPQICKGDTLTCGCVDNLRCSNGKGNGDRWCEGNTIKICDINSNSCQTSITTEATCQNPQVCNDEIIPTCKCVNECTLGERTKLTETTYKECVSGAPCDTEVTKTCPTGRIFNDYSDKCECKENLKSCNEAYLQNTLRCSSGSEREKCNKIAGSELGSEYCWEYTPYDMTSYPNTRECVGGGYQCKEVTCDHAECSGDGNMIRKCFTSSDPNCPTLGNFESCPQDYKCSTATFKCEPQHQCEPSNPYNGQYMRCNPGNNQEIQECKRGVDGVYRWVTVPALACNVGQICSTGSDAYCTLAYNVYIDTNQYYPVGMPITDVKVSIISTDLNIDNIIIIGCVESEKLGCSDETKYTSLVQIRTDSAGTTPILTFEPASKTGTWYVSSYVKDYKYSTLTHKPIFINNRLDLDVNAPTTGFINEDITVSYRAEDVDTKQILIPTLEIYLDMGGMNIPFTHTSVNEFSFRVDKTGSVHYRIIGKYSGYLEDEEEGYIEILHPLIESTLKLDGVNINELAEFRIDSGPAQIELVVRRGTENLRVDTTNLRIRNPAQKLGEGTSINFKRDVNNVYTTTYNFQESGKTYFLEGTYTLVETGDVIPIEKPINTKGGVADEPVFDPMLLYGVLGIFTVALITTILIIVVRKRKK